MPFNKETALDYLGNDEEIFDELVKIFLENYPDQLSQLEIAVKNRDNIDEEMNILNNLINDLVKAISDN